MQPDIYTDSETQADDDTPNWVIRLERRDVECHFSFIDKAGNINARLSSAMKLPKNIAKQYAKAISEQHKVYKARAFLYSTMTRKKKEEIK